MKLLTTLFALVFITNANADMQFIQKVELAYEYAVDFELVSTSSVCHEADTAKDCLAQNSQVLVKAKLNGCLDSLSYFEQDAYMYDDTLYINIASKGLFNPDSARVFCVAIPEVRKTIVTPFVYFNKVVINNINEK